MSGYKFGSKLTNLALILTVPWGEADSCVWQEESNIPEHVEHRSRPVLLYYCL
jgi:hypothetical protein